MDYEQFITEIKKYWDLRKKGLKKQANSFLFSFTKSFKENVLDADADAILFQFCREYLDEMKFPGDDLPRRHLPFRLTNKHTFYEKYYESCEKKSDKLTQTSNRVSLYRIITAAASGLMLFLWYRQKIPVFLVSAGLGFYRNNKVLSPIYQMNRTITPYRKLFQLLEQESFDSLYLKDLQKTLLKNGSASAALKDLEKITDSVCARHNIYVFLLYNSLFLHDYYCVEWYEKWKDSYKYSLKAWLKAVGNVEALISLSVICHTRKFHCLPVLTDSARPLLAASDIRHPLLKEPSAVGNDIDLTHGTCIITGSNMSGKTTFIRSIGINLALAYAGGFCTAASLRISLMELCTSIHTEDNVNEGISTFYAELLRIRRMIEVSKKQIPMISLIDEIYKGTNAKDRIFAAKETIRNLSKPYAVTLITTHDFELCDLEKDLDIHGKNYHFTEHYKENKILFDYKLKEGRCTTTNARYLLRMAGILK